MPGGKRIVFIVHFYLHFCVTVSEVFHTKFIVSFIPI